ncbi:MAG: glycosyltransferase family 2 protein [Pseudomonadales bacterium]|nr:glycosyltransferase family 2 protein [Pseudomonadales bacterium]
MNPPRIAVIILNWNGKDDTLACLASVTSIDYPDFQAVVVDNGSSDGSVAAFRQAYPQFTVLETGANLGYAGGNNVGIRWALDQGFDGLLVLNNDTVVARDILHAFAAAQEQFPQAGVFGAKIYYHAQPDVLWFAGGIWRSDNLEFDHVGKDRPDGPEFSEPRAFDYMTGCAIYAPAEVFRSVGLFGEEFFLTYEETDWCYRARAKGYTPTYIPAARLWHKVSASFGGAVSPLMTYFMARNRLLFVRRHQSAGTLARLLRKLLGELGKAIFPHPKFFLAGTWLSPRRFYWALGAYRREVGQRARQPQTRARLLGLKDFLLGRLGNCPDAVRALSKAAPGPDAAG